MSADNSLHPNNLLEILRRLKAAKISYRLDQIREDAVMIDVAVPGERREIELMENGAMEIERFKSTGEISDAAALEELFKRFSD